MRKINKGLISFPLFLLGILACGACAGGTLNVDINNIKNRVEKTDETEPMVLNGDFDRLFAKPLQVKPGYEYNPHRDPFDWDFYPQKMNYFEDDNGGYYETIIKLKKNDSLYATKNYNQTIKYDAALGNEFFESNSTHNNIYCKKDGVYRIKYRPSKVTNNNLNTGWEVAEEVNLPTKRVYWKYSHPELIEDTNKQGGISLCKKVKKNNQFEDLNITGWNFEYDTYQTVNGYNYADVSVALANGYDKIFFTYNTYSTQTPKMSLEMINHGGQDEAIFIDINNEENKPITVSMSALRRSKIDDFKVTNKTARLWLDKNGVFNDNYIPVLHVWNNTGLVKDFLPIEEVNMRHNGDYKLVYYDVDIDFFTKDYTCQFKAYQKVDGGYKYDTKTITMDKINPNRLIQTQPKDGNLITQIDATGYQKDINATQLAKVLEAYYTCSDSKLNGYGDFNTFKACWTGDNGERVVDFNEDVKMDDFTPVKDVDSAYASGVRGTKVLVKDKFTMMNQMHGNIANINQIMSFDNNQTITFIIVGASVIMVITVVLFITLRRKKARN